MARNQFRKTRKASRKLPAKTRKNLFNYLLSRSKKFVNGKYVKAIRGGGDFKDTNCDATPLTINDPFFTSFGNIVDNQLVIDNNKLNTESFGDILFMTDLNITNS